MVPYFARNQHLTFSGPVLCSLQYTVITVNEFADYSLELWVERVRDAVSSTEQHTNTALLTSTPRRLSGCLDPVLRPRVRSSPQPDADVQPLDRLHNGREEVEGKAGIVKFKFNFKIKLASFNFRQNARQIIIQIYYSQILNMHMQHNKITSVQYLSCNTRMCVAIKKETQKIPKKEKPHPDLDETMKLSPRIVLNKTQESKEVPRWSSCVTHLPAVWHRARVSCCTDKLFTFHIQII